MSNLIIWNWSLWPSCMVILQLFSQNISTLSHCLVRPAGPQSSKIPKIWPGGQQALIDYWPAGCKCRMPPGRWWHHCSRFLLDVGMMSPGLIRAGPGVRWADGVYIIPQEFLLFLVPPPPSRLVALFTWWAMTERWPGPMCGPQAPSLLMARW